MKDKSGKDDLMVFIDEPASEVSQPEPIEKNVWRILITDDEQDVHSATTFALRNTKILGRKLEFLHASSAKETVEILEKNRDIAVIILDVVMETPNAGLDLVAVIRKQLKINDSRIILRTGQPNQAPEIEVIRDYDINDYKLKSELTQTKLYAALTTAVRSYKQIRMIEASKEGLGLIVKSSAELLSQQGLNAFAHGVIVQLAALMGVPAEGLICVHHSNHERIEDSQIIAAAGSYCLLIDQPLSQLAEQSVRESLSSSLRNQCNVFASSGIALYLGSDERGGMSCYVANVANLDEIDAGLLELFCNNIRVFADNLSLLDRLKNHAYWDATLNLPNKIALCERISEVLTSSRKVEYALALLGIHGVEAIKSALGNEYMESILGAVALRLKQIFTEPLLIARVNSDTFAIFGESKQLPRELLLTPFNKHFDIDKQEQRVAATAVLRTFDIQSGHSAKIVEETLLVLDSEKKSKRSEVALYSNEKLEEVQLHFDLLNNVRSSFELDKLYLAFQPKFCLSSGKVTGLEALVRWKKEDGEVILPASFIPLAERSGLMVKLGEWILRNALATLARLNQAGIADICMSVNISAVQFQDKNMLSILDTAVADFSINPKNIDLEITESIAMDAVSSNLTLIQALKSRGFQLSVDDFGTGFSSLSFLRQASVDTLKIDQVFVNSSDTDTGREVIEMIIHLAKTLNLTVVAEGIETQVQKDILARLGCDQAQGFLLAKPMDESDLLRWFQQYSTTRAD